MLASATGAKVRVCTVDVFVAVGVEVNVGVTVGVLVDVPVGPGVFVPVAVGVLVGVLDGALPMEISHHLPSFSLGSAPLSTPRLTI